MLSLFSCALLCGEWVGLNRKTFLSQINNRAIKFLRFAAIDRERGSDLFIAGRLV